MNVRKTMPVPIRRKASLLAVLGAMLLGGAAFSTDAHAAGWNFLESDGLEILSGDGKAKASGTVNWYYGDWPYGYRHRANYAAGSKVSARVAVGCIWARVKFGYPNGSLTVGTSGSGGSISGGESYADGWYVKCRRSGYDRPTPISLYGVGYAKANLNSTTLYVGTSTSKSQGPRHVAYEKNSYGGG